ncbi:DUF3741 domain-containing protein/DUF4378 domain-containing protein [Cucumis melo var. makuwa]|uniref:DUF3741 domain-containing protein/DUF4378 domain-containing protein n=1 Tax=Cucumis melo var. makuwa TaxID=1194695 RepID=A0A5A7TH74_CUCMM|nr:DUF3741 domain-containing protein/DUF4378 domain-containing protein [Cucumis melo var. makuwa]
MGTKHMQSNSSMVGRVSKSHKMHCKAVDRPSKDLQQPSPKSLVNPSSKKLDSTASTRVACCRSQRFCTCKSCMEYSRHNEISLKLVQKNEASEPFSSKKFVGVADKQCKQLLDALGIFNSNKELFVNLLQDPNSLLIKRIEDNTESRNRKQQMMTFFDSRLSENKIREVGESDEPKCCQNLKPCDRLPAEDSDDSLSLERIVVLKPNSTSSLQAAVGTNYCSSLKSHSSCTKNGQSDKGTLFSFRQIKRKMKQAMRVGRKEGECLSSNGMPKETPVICRAPKDDGKQTVIGATRRSSYSKIQTDDKGISSSFQDSLERDQEDKAFYSRNGDKTASTSESTYKKVVQPAVLSNLKRQKSKKHEGDKEVSRKMKAKPWGWVMCFSDDDILPSNKPGCHTAGRMRYSHLGNKKFIHEKKTQPQNDEEQCCKTPEMVKVGASFAEAGRDDDQLHASTTELNVSPVIFPEVDQDPIIEGSVKLIKEVTTVQQERSNFCEALSRFDNSSNTSYCQRTNKNEGFGEKGNPELSKPNLPLEVQPSAFSVDTFPSSSLQFQTVEDPNGFCDRVVQPLPEPINDQLLVDATSSNLAITSGTAEPSSEALPINFEEDQCTGLARLQEVLDPAIASFHCCGSTSQCILELLQVSKQNWNELSMDCHSSTWLQISFVDKVKMFSSQLCGDCVLLFDYFNEVLEDVFHCYVRCSSWLSSYKPHIQAPNKESTFYHEVMQHMDWSLLQQQPPQTLDHLCLRDLKSRTWIDYPTETEEVVTIIAESVLRELIIESVVYLGL